MKTSLREPYKIFFGTLSNQTRLDVIEVLMEGPKNVTDISRSAKIEQSMVSHNLKRLEECGFVKATPKGKERIYEVNHSTIQPLIDLMHTHMRKHCCKIAGKKI